MPATFKPLASHAPTFRLPITVSRRRFLGHAARLVAGAAAAAGTGVPSASGATPKRLKIAAILTQFTHRSHAHVILENFLEPYLFDGNPTESGMDVVAFFVDQSPANDMARDVAARYQIRIYPTIAQALCRGGDRLAVDAVLSIGEHGKYPINAKGQLEYPRKRFFDEIVAVFRASGRVAPVFTDKHLSYRWEWAKEMYDTARRLKIPFMAGSSVPLAERRPALELPHPARIAEAVSIHSGPVESYDFHGLEVLQSMIESRRRRETGVARVQFLHGEALWKAAEGGQWSPELAQAALSTDMPSKSALAADLIRAPGPGDSREPFVKHGIRIEYRDGLRAMILAVAQGGGIKWHFACRLENESAPRATSFYVGPWQNRNLFKALSHAIQHHFRERRPPYPVERTLLTTGILAAAMDSRFEGGRPVPTPHLALSYKAVDFRAMREMGATWRILTEDLPEPRGINPLGR